MILYNLFEKKMPGALISLKQILQSENSLTISSAVHEFCQNTTTSRNFTLISLLKTTAEIIIPINKIRPWKSYGNNGKKLEPMSFLSMRVTKNSLKKATKVLSSLFVFCFILTHYPTSGAKQLPFQERYIKTFGKCTDMCTYWVVNVKGFYLLLCLSHLDHFCFHPLIWRQKKTAPVNCDDRNEHFVKPKRHFMWM